MRQMLMKHNLNAKRRANDRLVAYNTKSDDNLWRLFYRDEFGGNDGRPPNCGRPNGNEAIGRRGGKGDPDGGGGAG